MNENQLRKEREKAGLLLREVGQFYGAHGATVGRICQIESAPDLSAKVEWKYRRALAAAVEWKRKLDEVGTTVAAARKEFHARILQGVDGG